MPVLLCCEGGCKHALGGSQAFRSLLLPTGVRCSQTLMYPGVLLHLHAGRSSEPCQCRWSWRSGQTEMKGVFGSEGLSDAGLVSADIPCQSLCSSSGLESCVSAVERSPAKGSRNQPEFATEGCKRQGRELSIQTGAPQRSVHTANGPCSGLNHRPAHHHVGAGGSRPIAGPELPLSGPG